MLGTKTSYHRHKGVSVGWVNSFWLSKLLYFGWVRWNFVTTGRSERRWVGTPGRRCRCSGRRRRFAPPPAPAAATAARHALPPSLTAPSFHKISFYSAKIKQFTQPTETPLCLWYDVFLPTLPQINDPPYTFRNKLIKLTKLLLLWNHLKISLFWDKIPVLLQSLKLGPTGLAV